MNTDSSPGRGGRLQLILIVLIFAIPLVAATWLYFADSALRPAGTTNHGTLFSPVINLREELPDSPLLAQAGSRWVLLYQQSGNCDDACRDALYKQRQARLMLGNDMSRVTRILLHGPQAPDTLFLDEEYPGLIALNDSSARQLLIDVHPRGIPADGYYLIDPLGNLVMFFPPDVAPRDLVDDLERLLKLSRIG